MRAAILCTLLAASLPAPAAAETKCKVVQIAEWPLRPKYFRPVVDGAINGQKIGILLDTGAALSVLRRSAAAKLGITRTLGRAPRLFGIGGETQVETTRVDEFRIGDIVTRDWPALIAGEGEFVDDLAFYLGHDFFQQADVEFDLANNAVRLYQVTGCRGVSLAYWSKDALVLPLEAGRKIELAVSVNGRAMIAELDSGASLSTLSMLAARELGLRSQTPGAVPAGCVRGTGQERFDSWLLPLESFAIGNEVIHNPTIPFADLWQHMRTEGIGSNLRQRFENSADLILGADFLRSHRVLVSHSQRKIYFSYVGGTVFRGAPGKPCSATPQ